MVVTTPFLAEDGFTVTFQGMTATELRAIQNAIAQTADSSPDHHPIQPIADALEAAVARMDEREVAAMS